MSKKVVAISGTYRKGRAVDTIVDEVLRGAKEAGAETEKIYLLDKRIEFCTNCRACTLEPGVEPGKCAIDDEFAEVMKSCLSADGIVIGSPVNFYNVNAITRRWIERHVCTAYWPWHSHGAPKWRNPATPRKSVLVTAAAAPGFLIPIATGAVRALKAVSKCLGAKPVATIAAGLMGEESHPKVSPKTLKKAYEAGRRLAL